MEGKVCLITGATSGIGAATAMELAMLGATTIIVGRNRRKCERISQRIKRKTENEAVEFLAADLSSQQEVRYLAAEFKNRHNHLAVLINNAGAIFAKRQQTADGIEMTFALNHLAYFLLTNLLLDCLKASPSARIVVVASVAHNKGTLRFDDLQGERHYDRLEAYRQSKLANVLFAYELARRLAGTRVSVNALDPGSVATNLGRNNSWLRTRMRNLLVRSMVNPQEGARTVVYLASCPEVEGKTGHYFKNQKEIPSSDGSHDTSVARGLWLVSEELTGVRFPN
jgi:NAD(P)-dependent dehydrogenase (short-subunit alcohol dehydrogenase family)